MKIRWLTYFIVGFWVLAGSLAFAQNTTTEYAPVSPDDDPNRTGFELALIAKLTADSKTIEREMIWRVFGDTADENGKLPVIATAKGGSATLTLPGGAYLIHAGFGRAGASKRVEVKSGNVTESFVLQAGGLELDALSNEQVIPPEDLRFSIFGVEEDDNGERKMIAHNVAARKIIPLNEGTYHVLSRYGDINATVRADLEVKAGQITKAMLQHRGAAVSLRLVSRSGGDPIANTSWSVLTGDGEEVYVSKTVAPAMILSQGTYEAVVKNGDKNFRKTFVVQPGKNQAGRSAFELGIFYKIGIDLMIRKRVITNR